MQKKGIVTKIKYSSQFEFFILIFLVITLIIMMFSFTSYLWLSRILQQNAAENNLRLLTQIRNVNELVLHNVEKSIASIMLDSSLNSYFTYVRSGDIFMQLMSRQKLMEYQNTSDDIISICIYYLEDDYVLSTDQGAGIAKDYHDYSFLSEIRDKGMYDSHVIARSIPAPYASYQEPVVTLIRYLPINFSGKPKAVILVNIKNELIQQSLTSVGYDSDMSILITDRGGQLLSKKSGTMSDKDILELSETSEVSQALGQTGVQKEIQGQAYLINCVQSVSTGWQYISATPSKSVFQGLEIIRNIIIVLSVFFLAVSIPGGLILSRRLSLPIRRISRALKGRLPGRAYASIVHTETREVESKVNGLIEHSISLEEKNKSLEEMLGQFELYQRNKFLSDLLYGVAGEKETILNSLHYYHVDIADGDAYHILQIAMDRYHEFSMAYSLKQKNMIRVYTQDSIKQVLPANYFCEIIHHGENETVAIIWSKQKSDNFSNEIKSLVLKIKQQIFEQFNYSFSIGVSQPYESISDIPTAYRETSAALGQRIFYGYNHVHWYNNVNSKSKPLVYPEREERQLLSALKNGDRGSIKKLLENTADHFSRMDNLQNHVVQHYYMLLASTLLKGIIETGRQPEMLGISYQDILSRLAEEDTIPGLSKILEEIFDKAMISPEDLKESRHQELINAVIQFIENHLGEDLSIERIADVFKTSSSNLRKIFKDETGITIKNYIDRQRMEQAKTLLKDPNIKIVEIAELVGYISFSAFTRAFRLANGVTPGEYRRNFTDGFIQNDGKTQECI